jgi:hypothetical protein
MKIAVSRIRLIVSAMLVVPVLAWEALRGEACLPPREDGLELS